MIRLLFVVILSLWFIIPCNCAQSNPSNPDNVVYIVKGVRTKIVTDRWNTWKYWRTFYKWFRNILRR